MYLEQALDDGSLWFVGDCLLMLVAISVGLYTRTGSGINAHPYSRTGMLASDLPPEAIGRADIEPLLRRRRR